MIAIASMLKGFQIRIFPYGVDVTFQFRDFLLLKVPVMNVNTTIVSGRAYHRQTGKKDDEVLKDDDRKLAFVTLRREASRFTCVII